MTIPTTAKTTFTELVELAGKEILEHPTLWSHLETRPRLEILCLSSQRPSRLSTQNLRSWSAVGEVWEEGGGGMEAAEAVVVAEEVEDVEVVEVEAGGEEPCLEI